MENGSALLNLASLWPTLLVTMYIWTVFALSLASIFWIKKLPNHMRRVLGLTTMAIQAHALWWLPFIFNNGQPNYGIDILLSGLSQFVAISGLCLAFRMHIQKSTSTRRTWNSLATAIIYAVTTIVTLLLGYMSIGRMPAPMPPSTLALAVFYALLTPGLLFCMTVIKISASKAFKILLASAIGALSTISAAHGLDLLTAPVLPSTVVEVAPFWKVWFCSLTITSIMLALIMAGSYWLEQLRFITHIRSTLEALPIGIALYDERDRLTLWNSTFENLGTYKATRLRVGMTYLEALKEGMKSSLYPADATRNDDWILEHLEKRVIGDWVYQSQDKTKWIHLQNRLIGKSGMVTISSDFTAQKKHEAELAQALDVARNANLAKSRFLANMSHEIRTPLNGIIAVTEALSRSDLSEKQGEMVALVRSSSDTLQILLSDILDMARIESGQININRSPFDLTKLLDSTQKLYAS